MTVYITLTEILYIYLRLKYIGIPNMLHCNMLGIQAVILLAQCVL